MLRVVFKHFVVFCFLLCIAGSTLAQQKYTLSGYVNDSLNGEVLIGANVYVPELERGTITNQYGFYSLTLPEDSLTIVVSYVGYQPDKRHIYLGADRHVNVALQASVELDEVEIVAAREPDIAEETQMSKTKLSTKQIKQIPALMGEQDLVKATQLLPGVQSGMEGGSGMYVRGGSPDQNLIRMDGVPVYNVDHLFGFFSIFNVDAVNDVALIKGGFPARFGGRLSSVLDITMKEGNRKKLKGSGAVGLIASRLTLEGPIKKDKTSFLVSGRRTYFDLITRPIIRAMSDGNQVAGYYFYDLNGKVQHTFSEKNKLYASFYMGDDRLYVFDENEVGTDRDIFRNEFGMNWGNIIGSLRWNHMWNNKTFVNTTLNYTRYRFSVDTEHKMSSQDGDVIEQSRLTYHSGIRDWSIQSDVEYRPNPNHYIRFGGMAILHRFTPGVESREFRIGNVGMDTSFGANIIPAQEYGLYAEDDIRVTSRLKANVGLRLSGFTVRDKFYYAVEPRLAARYYLTDEWAAKASYARMQQYVHLLTFSGMGLPTDLWLPATDRVPPQRSDQVAAGIARTFRNKQYELSVEGYYKHMNNVIAYQEGAGFFGTSFDWEDQVESGTAWSYGAEVFFQRKKGRLTGWIGYTLSWAYRQFDNINFGDSFFFRYDRRHDIALTAAYDITDNIDLSGTWIYGTGYWTTLPLANYRSPFSQQGNGQSFNNVNIEYFGTRNNFRMPAYHRFDVSVNFNKETSWGERTWNISIYNVYNRRNAFFLFQTVNDQGDNVIRQMTLFPIIPSVSYQFRF